MYANYHTHTYHCKHADGMPREYVEAAIQNGVRILGFSDHVPYPFSTGHRSRFRMHESETARYVQEIQDLRTEYAGKLQIHIGYEAEYYPAEFDAMLETIRPYECQYLILGQHFTRNEYDGSHVYEQTGDTERLSLYVDQLIAGMETGLFSYIAHPDMLYYRGDDAFYRKEVQRLCEAARAEEMPLEINLLGFRGGRAYPYAPFWEVAGRVGALVVLGYDAHCAEAFSEQKAEETAREWVKLYGLMLQEEVPLRPVLVDDGGVNP